MRAGLVASAFVDRGDRAGNGCVNVARRFHGLHHANLFAGFHLRADLRKLDIDHIREFRLRMVGDADSSALAIKAQPFMGLGVLRLSGTFMIAR